MLTNVSSCHDSQYFSKKKKFQKFYNKEILKVRKFQVDSINNRGEIKKKPAAWWNPPPSSMNRVNVNPGLH